MRGRKRVIVIGLDGATFDLIKPWMGRLPNFAKFIAEGTHGILKSTLPPMSPPAWASFQTGVNPGKHGIFHFCEPNLDKPYQPVGSFSFRKKPFWEFISEKGKTVGIVNLFGTFPPKPINGFIISGRNVPRGKNFTYPPHLENEIKEKVGNYIIDIDPYHATKALKYISKDEFLELLHKMLSLRIKTFWYLVERYKPDLFIIVFTAIDMVQHFFWKYLDRSHPDHCDDERYRDAILGVYKKFDEYIGEVTSALGDNAVIFIVSDHGHGPWHKEVNLNRWLMEHGFLHVRKGAISLKNVLKKLSKAVLPPSFWETFKRKTQKVKKLYREMPIDWSKTKAFAFGHYGNIYINLKGKQPLGIVEPGQEYDSLCKDIEQKLLEWINPITGRRMVKKVYKRHELYSGDALTYAPDLVVEWEDYAYISSHASDYRSPMITEVHSFYKNVPQSGSHRLDGIFIAKGPNIKSNHHIHKVNITDIAPTVLYLFGQPIPTYMDGKVLTELFDESFIAANPITTYEFTQEVVTEEKEAFSQDEAEQIKEQLKGLGYM